jgi:hypothetical protein
MFVRLTTKQLENCFGVSRRMRNYDAEFESRRRACTGRKSGCASLVFFSLCTVVGGCSASFFLCWSSRSALEKLRRSARSPTV